MAETKHSQENLAYIRTHVDNLERMVRFQIAANPQSLAALQARLERPGMAEVYLTLESGPKTQEELVKDLRLSQPTVSRVCAELLNAGMVTRIPSVSDRRRMAYTWTDLEDMLGVSKMVRTFLASQEQVKRDRSSRPAKPKAAKKK